MVVTVAVELVIGFAFAMVMHRIIFGRGVMRTAILIPYGIVTVVSPSPGSSRSASTTAS
jgi:ABC-type sugar transport systems, permease components